MKKRWKLMSICVSLVLLLAALPASAGELTEVTLNEWHTRSSTRLSTPRSSWAISRRKELI